jgi:hypothetical protein
MFIELRGSVFKILLTCYLSHIWSLFKFIVVRLKLSCTFWLELFSFIPSDILQKYMRSPYTYTGRELRMPDLSFGIKHIA